MSNMTMSYYRQDENPHTMLQTNVPEIAIRNAKINLQKACLLFMNA